MIEIYGLANPGVFLLGPIVFEAEYLFLVC